MGKSVEESRPDEAYQVWHTRLVNRIVAPLYTREYTAEKHVPGTMYQVPWYSSAFRRLLVKRLFRDTCVNVRECTPENDVTICEFRRLFFDYRDTKSPSTRLSAPATLNSNSEQRVAPTQQRIWTPSPVNSITKKVRRASSSLYSQVVSLHLEDQLMPASFTFIPFSSLLASIACYIQSILQVFWYCEYSAEVAATTTGIPPVLALPALQNLKILEVPAVSTIS